MEPGKKVFYKGTEYVIFYSYQNGYCEIKEITEPHIINVLLVPEENITLMN